MATCYRHPSRETGVSCSNCGNPICTDCMTSTPVGMRCPDCAKQSTKVVRGVGPVTDNPIATYVLIALNVLIFFGSRSGEAAYLDFELIAVSGTFVDPTGVSQGEVWRMITGGFLHAQGSRGILHVAFNMYVLWWLGNLLERDLGTPRFLALYFGSMLAGSFGALALTEVERGTVGASGAVFGLMAAAFVLERARGIDPMQSGLGPVILMNLAITFLIPGISIGGHLGGLVGGALIAIAWDRLKLRFRRQGLAVGIALAVGLLAGVGGYVVADQRVAAKYGDQLARVR